jgi:hypothetical protein
MHGKFREIKAAGGRRLAFDWIWFRHPGSQNVASLSPIEHLLTCGLATFHEVANKPPAVDNGGSDAASGI